MNKYSNVTLKRGTFASDNEYYDWWNTVNLNTIERRDVIIELLDHNRDVVITWTLLNAFPIKVKLAGLKADSSEAAIESMELVHEGLTITND